MTVIQESELHFFFSQIFCWIGGIKQVAMKSS